MKEAKGVNVGYTSSALLIHCLIGYITIAIARSFGDDEGPYCKATVESSIVCIVCVASLPMWESSLFVHKWGSSMPVHAYPRISTHMHLMSFHVFIL